MIKNPKELLQKVEDDIANYRLIQGDYWYDGKGCFVGCLRHGGDHSAGGPLDAPSWAYHLWDALHENLPIEAIEDNYRMQVTAVVNAQIPSHTDKRWTEIYHALMARMLRRCVARINDAVVIKAIEQVVAYHENPNRTERERVEAAEAAWAAVQSAARSAAWSAWSAARAAAESVAARPATWSAARSAAASAEAAALWAAAWLAMSEEYQRIAYDFVELLEAKLNA